MLVIEIAAGVLLAGVVWVVGWDQLNRLYDWWTLGRLQNANRRRWEREHHV